MKKMLLSSLMLLNALWLGAQGIYNLWGITTGGGPDGFGVIYKTDGAGNHYQVKHHFGYTAPGSQPQFCQLADYQNKFYGMTRSAGPLSGGNIFEWDPVTNLLTSKIDFTGPNGNHPYGSLILLNNKFYGMTAEGGSNNAGVIFEWDPASNVFTKKIDLADSSGAHPQGDLLYYNGNFYGSTPEGGAYDVGVLFKWNPATNVYQKILDFDRENGETPNSTMLLLEGQIYGVSGGAIFQLDPATDQFTKRFVFTYYETGEAPVGNIIADRGKIYGFHNDPYVNDEGSTTNRQGIFEWNPATGVFVKRGYTDINSIYGWRANLVKAANKLYGALDGFGDSPGSLFEWDAATDSIKKLFDFSLYDYSGVHPTNPLSFKNGILYGMTAGGGAYGLEEEGSGLGVIYQWDIASGTYTKRLDLAGTMSNSGIAGLSYYKGKLYGRTGSSTGGGSIFEFDPQTNTYSDKTGFADGGYSYNPVGSMVLFQDKLYGVCRGGGARGYGGEIFEYNPVSNVYSGKHYFLWPSPYGFFPNGNLTVYNNLLYGSTSDGGYIDGGYSRTGVFFSLDPVSSNYQVIPGMQPPDVSIPSTSLTLFNNKLYGGSSSGGAYSQGLLFEWNPVDNSYTKKIDLTAAGGTAPADMTLFKNKLYGAARSGGAANAGALFEWDPVASVYTKKIDFNGANGSVPNGAMVLNNGKLYGTTLYGGDAGAGILFEWDPATNQYSKKKDFGAADGSLPSGPLTLAPAPVAAGKAAVCTILPAVNINTSNNQQWVPITDEAGNAVAEINANGNNLGAVTATLYINSGTLRQTARHQPYLDRNISLTAAVQPVKPVSIRLYITTAEYNRLKAAANQYAAGSIKDSSGLIIYRAAGNCAASVAALTQANATRAAAWENDLVLSATVNELGGFFIAGKAVCSAPLISKIIANPAMLWPPDHKLKNVKLQYSITAACAPVSVWLTVSSNEKSCGQADWVIKNDHLLQLRAERAGNGKGRVYTITVHAKDAAGNTSIQCVTVTVPHSFGCTRSKEATGSDDIVDQELSCRVLPNPSSNYFNLQVQGGSGKNIELSLSDINGRVINKWTTTSSNTRFGDQLLPGIYLLRVTQGEQQVPLKLVKQ